MPKQICETYAFHTKNSYLYEEITNHVTMQRCHADECMRITPLLSV